ncbi:MAG: S8 family peptidase [Candidatus Kariarchaeaceae archaeon]
MKIISILTILSLTLSLVGIVGTSAAATFEGFNGADSIGFDNEVSSYLVEEVSDDLTMTATNVDIIPWWTDLVNTENVDQDGSGVYVAVLDTGLVPQWPFFFSQATIRDDLGVGFSHDLSWDYVINDLVISPLKSDRGFITNFASGHGTHVTSTITGFNLNGAWVDGVSPGVQIIPVLVLDAWIVDSPYGLLGFRGGTDAMIAAGINYIADLAPTLDGPVVINMSLGGPSPQPAILAAIQNAIAEGVIVVVSAGNSGMNGMGYPGGFPEVISVAAAGWDNMFASGWNSDAPEDANIYLEDFSSRPNKALGQKHKDLDVAAPGAFVVGPYKSAFANNLGYYYLSGTSMAAPHVAATAALVLESHPDLTQTEMEFILKLAARGNPLPANDAVVFFPFNADGFYTANWDGGDYGAGFLYVDQAIATAAIHA